MNASSIPYSPRPTIKFVELPPLLAQRVSEPVGFTARPALGTAYATELFGYSITRLKLDVLLGSS